MKKFFANVNWVNIAVIAVTAVITVKIIYPKIQPYLAKIPLIGGLFMA